MWPIFFRISIESVTRLTTSTCRPRWLTLTNADALLWLLQKTETARRHNQYFAGNANRENSVNMQQNKVEWC
jgi:hypothetical protein